MGRYRHKRTGEVVYYSDTIKYDPYTDRYYEENSLDDSDEWEKI